MEIGQVIWDAVLGVGTTLTLTVIVAIALALGALAIFYVSSAVVVLERFARTAPRARWVVLFAAAVVAVTSTLQLDARGDYDVSIDALGALQLVGGIAAATALCIGVCWLALRWLSSTRLGTVSLVIMGLGAACIVGGTGAVVAASMPPLGVGLIALAIWVRRRLRRRTQAGGGRSLAQSQLVLLAAVLAVGPLLAALLPEPDFRVSVAGTAALQGMAMLVVLGLLPLAAAGLVEMHRSAEWFIAIRYLVAQRRQVYISAVTLLCIGGIAAGVWLIVTVLSVMNGFERAWREQIVGDLAHFTVHSGLGRMFEYEPVLEMVRAVPDVQAASPFLDAEGMVRSESGKLFGVRLRGVDPATADSVTDISSRIENGSLAFLATPPASGERRVPAIIIGGPLADKLGAELGTDLILISPLGGPPTPLGPAPRLKKFRVAGIYQSRLHQFGEVYTYVNLADAQDFVRAEGAIDGIEARTGDLYTSRRVADEVRSKLDSPYYTRDWKDHFPVFFAALRDNRSMMILLLGMIMVVAAFMIVATLMMMIMEKSSDIAILKAMGAEDATIERIFAIEGALIGMSGTTLGVLAALAVTARLEWIQTSIEAVTGIDTLPASIYQLSTLPADHDPVQLIGIVAMAMVLSLGATLVPARQGARFDPVEGLRSE